MRLIDEQRAIHGDETSVEVRQDRVVDDEHVGVGDDDIRVARLANCHAITTLPLGVVVNIALGEARRVVSAPLSAGATGIAAITAASVGGADELHGLLGHLAVVVRLATNLSKREVGEGDASVGDLAVSVLGCQHVRRRDDHRLGSGLAGHVRGGGDDGG